jgi:hypothetical protein
MHVYMYTCIWTDRKTHRKTDVWTDEWTHRQTHGRRDRLTGEYRWVDKWTDRLRQADTWREG